MITRRASQEQLVLNGALDVLNVLNHDCTFTYLLPDTTFQVQYSIKHYLCVIILRRQMKKIYQGNYEKRDTQARNTNSQNLIL